MRKSFWLLSIFLFMVIFTSTNCRNKINLQNGDRISKDALTRYTLNWVTPPDTIIDKVSEYTVEFYVLENQDQDLYRDVFRLTPVYETSTRDNKINFPAELARNLQEGQVVQWDVTAKNRRRGRSIIRGMFGIESDLDMIEWPSPNCFSCRNVLTEEDGEEVCKRECKYVPDCSGAVPNTHDATWDLDHDDDDDTSDTSGGSALRDSDRFYAIADDFPITIETNITISVPCAIVDSVSTVRVIGHIFNGNSRVPTGNDLSINFWLLHNEPGVSHADSVTVDSSLYVRSCTDEGMVCTVPIFCRVIYGNSNFSSQLLSDQHIVVQIKDLEHDIPYSCQSCRDNHPMNTFEYFNCLDTCDDHMNKHILIHKFKSAQGQILDI